MKDKKKLTHVMFTYKGEFHQSWKDWSFDRIERVLERLGASYWEIGVPEEKAEEVIEEIGAKNREIIRPNDQIKKSIRDVNEMCLKSIDPDSFEEWAGILKLLSKVYGDEILPECPACCGFGYTPEHAKHPHPEGDCCGECPVKAQCEACEGTGIQKV